MTWNIPANISWGPKIRKDDNHGWRQRGSYQVCPWCAAGLVQNWMRHGPGEPDPGGLKIPGLLVYPSRSVIDRLLGMVEVFRRPKDLSGIVLETVEIGAKVLWGKSGCAMMNLSGLPRVSA